MVKNKRDRWSSSSSEDEDDDIKTTKTKNQTRATRQRGVRQERQSSSEKPKTTPLIQAVAATATIITGDDTTKATLSSDAAPLHLRTHDGSSSRPSSLPLHNPLLHGCRSVYDTYDRISRVSEGTYGVVWKARDLATNDIVALKQIKFNVLTDDEQRMASSTQNKEGFPLVALREVNVLLSLSHESIVSVREMVVGDGLDKVFMVMEFFEFDLKDGIDRFDGALAQSELKGILQQVLSAVDYMHAKWYLHRDIKTSNILVHRSDGRIALADFGLARRYQDPPQALTQLVVTLWYRAPELLFGECRYGPPVDMWSVGCTFGELIRREAIMPGQGELDQIDQIFSMVGVPTPESWPSFENLPNAGLFRWKPRLQKDLLLPKLFPIASPTSGGSKQAFLDANGYDLLQRMLTCDPGQRITAKQALEHAYFTQGVQPTMPHFFSASE
jgi:cell division cycle 2-like